MELLVNTLLEWRKKEDEEHPKVDRVLWIDHEGSNDVSLIGLFSDQSLPVWCPRSLLDEAFEAGELRCLDIDPFAMLHRPDECLLPKHRERRDAAWDIISPIIASGKNAFLRKPRGTLVASAVERRGRSKRMIYWYLRRYWQAGQTINALVP